jgi:hypothetical protein
MYFERLPDIYDRHREYEAEHYTEEEEDEDDDYIRYAYLFRTLNRRHRLNELEGKK